MWFELFGKAVKRYGFVQSQAYHKMFYKHSREGEMVVLIVYVDDTILTSDDSEGIMKL